MPSYAAFIGHQPHLSLAELAVTVPGFFLQRKIGKNVLMFDSGTSLDAAFLDTVGGTVILSEQLPDAPKNLEDLPAFFASMLMPVHGKVTFSVRAGGLSPKQVQNLYRDTKDRLKHKGKPSRYVGSAREAAPSIVLRQNKLLDGTGGHELCVIQEEEQPLWVGKTVAAQDIESYTTRDMKKPVRDTTVGLLPPKLAQVLLNMGLWMVKNKEKKLTVYDPFCGTGVIPMECVLRGFATLASDKAEKAVTGCKKNLDWAHKTFKLSKSDAPASVWKQDATKAFDAKKTPALKNGVDLIVTETSLGPAWKKRPTIKEAQTARAENEDLQIEFLTAAAQSLPGAPIACMWPVWYTSKGPVFLDRVWKTIDRLGYDPMLPPHLEPTEGSRFSLLYRRPDQFVGREIVLLKPRKR